MSPEGENGSGVVTYPFLFHGAENRVANQIAERMVNAFTTYKDLACKSFEADLSVCRTFYDLLNIKCLLQMSVTEQIQQYSGYSSESVQFLINTVSDQWALI